MTQLPSADLSPERIKALTDGLPDTIERQAAELFDLAHTVARMGEHLHDRYRSLSRAISVLLHDETKDVWNRGDVAMEVEQRLSLHVVWQVLDGLGEMANESTARNALIVRQMAAAVQREAP